MDSIASLRKEYNREGLRRSALLSDPIDQFRRWFDQACEANLLEPNAFSLATVSGSGVPSQRIVLLKALDARGFVFFTNYESDKMRDIATNPTVSMLFPWVGLERQVRIIGDAEKISTAESLRYFTSRPVGSRLGAWVSQQSSVISSRSVLEQKLAEMKQKFSDGKIPLPSFWGGVRVKPQQFEFWQGRQNRLHDRFRYRKDSTQNWLIERLAP